VWNTVNENYFHSFSPSSSFSISLCKCVWYFLARSILCRFNTFTISPSLSISSHDEFHLSLFLSILSQFYGCGCPIGAFKLCCFLFHDIHRALKNYVIYNSTTDSSNSQDSLYHNSQMFQSICHYLPSPLTSCPS